ncbi:amidohydrolase family protein [Ramlibacter rhizophilus]|uniref:Amidohydrolase n=1 Tax=Ramlibacter rhizophilus TaxID=1781167 RepID=A0A4Z0BK43_9BURK|nr:amidohydrolase family protein [Ramlibacter rhizophilus]TFY98627.1 amidohydrolase [Ramlibacter rhizophilus]
MKPSTPVLLDVHAHLVPLVGSDLADIEGVQCTPAGRLVVDGHELANAQVYEPQQLLEWMDRHGVEAAWVSVPPTLYRPALDAASAQRWSLRLNEALDRMVAAHASRLSALHHLPVQHPEVTAIVAAERIAAGHARFAMPAGDPVGLRVLSDAAYEPLWSALDAAGAFLFLHPPQACDPRLRALSLTNLLGGPGETALAGAHLAMGGIAERHPRITFCLAHGGGSLPAVAGRLARGQDTGREGAWLGGEKVRKALRRLCVDCITHDADALALAASTFGTDRVLFGSDWPFAMGVQEPGRWLEFLPRELAARIAQDNPAQLLARHGRPGGEGAA